MSRFRKEVGATNWRAVPNTTKVDLIEGILMGNHGEGTQSRKQVKEDYRPKKIISRLELMEKNSSDNETIIRAQKAINLLKNFNADFPTTEQQRKIVLNSTYDVDNNQSLKKR